MWDEARVKTSDAQEQKVLLAKEGDRKRQKKNAEEGASKTKRRLESMGAESWRDGAGQLRPAWGERGGGNHRLPELTEHEHRTVAHHGGTSQSRLSRAGGNRQNLLERRAAKKTLPPQG